MIDFNLSGVQSGLVFDLGADAGNEYAWLTSAGRYSASGFVRFSRGLALAGVSGVVGLSASCSFEALRVADWTGLSSVCFASATRRPEKTSLTLESDVGYGTSLSASDIGALGAGESLSNRLIGLLEPSERIGAVGIVTACQAERAASTAISEAAKGDIDSSVAVITETGGRRESVRTGHGITYGPRRGNVIRQGVAAGRRRSRRRGWGEMHGSARENHTRTYVTAAGRVDPGWTVVDIIPPLVPPEPIPQDLEFNLHGVQSGLTFDLGGRGYYLHLPYSLIMAHSISLSVNGDQIPLGGSIDISESWADWGFSVELKLLGADGFNLAYEVMMSNNPVIATLSVDNIDYSIVLRTPRVSLKHNQSSYSVTGLSLTSLLNEPYAPKLSYTEPLQRTAQQLASSALPIDWSIQWDVNLPDWPVPGGVYSYSGLAPISVVKAVVESAGGFILSHRTDKIILAKRKYKQRPFGTLNPDFTATENLWTGLDLAKEVKSQYDAVYLRGTKTAQAWVVRIDGSGGLNPAPDEIVDDIITSEAAARCRGEVELANRRNVRTFTVTAACTGAAGAAPLAAVGDVIAVQAKAKLVCGFATQVRLTAEMDGGAVKLRQVITVASYE